MVDDRRQSDRWIIEDVEKKNHLKNHFIFVKIILFFLVVDSFD